LDNGAKEKIEHEICRIDKMINDATPLLNLCKIKEPDFVEITATAQILHSFYNGVESVAILFLKSIGERLPNDMRWHKTLFEMVFGSNSKNIVMLGSGLKDNLQKYMYFRHFIRHSYSSELIWSEMEPLVKNLEEIWGTIKADFESLINDN
jgi:hypothetical protein